MLNKRTNRRGFLKLGAGAMTAAAAATVIRPNFARAEDMGAVVHGEITRNHGHMFTAPLETLLENGPQTYSIQGASSHPHDIVIDEATLEALASGMTVELESSNVSGHSHMVLLAAQ